MNILKNTTFCMVSVVFGVAQLSADIVTPTSVIPSSEFAAANNMINGSGLSGVGAIESQLHNNNENHMWQTFSATSVGETAEFILDANYNLSSALIWQYNGVSGLGQAETDREINEFALSVSFDMVSPFVLLGTFNLAPALDQLAGGFNEPAQTFDLIGANDVRRVLLTINSVQGGISDGTAGLSEVRFNVVPEPGTAVLVLIGYPLVGWVRRRNTHRRDTSVLQGLKKS
jgi:hypothetical protein